MPLILIVDDNDIYRELLQAMLETAEHRVVAAASGLEGFVAFCKHTPELVITDLHLPDMTGTQLIRDMRQVDRKGRFILVSATAAPQDLAAVAADGDQPVPNLPKPFKQDTLLALVDETLQASR